MDCNFIETESFYSIQSSGQGENRQVSDPLNWLSDPVTLEPQLHSTIQSSHTSPATESQSPPDTPSPDTPAHEVTNFNAFDSTDGFDQETEPEEQYMVPESETVEESESHGYVLPPRSTRGVLPKRYDPYHVGKQSKYPTVNIARGSLSTLAQAYSAAVYSEQLPRNEQEALKQKVWREAMNSEMEALRKNETWEKVTPPPEKKPVGCRWVFTIKRKADGSIERYKARLVAKGYTQTYGVDYTETFSPVSKIDTIRVLFSVAANKNWPLYQFDVKNAFLHGTLEEEVYMDPPPGYSKEFEGKVCRLKRALYGLKQSPRAWFGRFTEAMKKFGYNQSNSDHTLFIKRQENRVTCLVIYVDDMIITGDDAEEIEHLKENLFKEFEMKDLGLLKYFLGIEVLRSKKGIYISQRKYVMDLLVETGLVDCKPAETPIVTNHGLSFVEGAKSADQERYQHLVGKLIYLAHTRPDISYAVGVLSQFMHRPQINHMEAALRVVRYLKGTPGRGILFQNHEHLEVEAYTDADWAGSQIDRRSTSGYFTLVGGNLVTWKSKKQKVVALSSAEAEFRGIARGITEVLWLRKILSEIGFPCQRACQLKCDNKAAISISENPVQHDRTKHVEIDRHFIKEKLEGGLISLPFVRSEDQLADVLTKAVNGRSFETVMNKLNVCDPTIQLEGECQR